MSESTNKQLDKMFPSMKKEENQSGSTLDFPNSPSMDTAIAEKEAIEAKERQKRKEYQFEMENIRKYGPIIRGSQTIISEEEQKEIYDVAYAGNFKNLAAQYITYLETAKVEVNEEDLKKIEDFFSSGDRGDLATQTKKAESVMWARSLAKKHKGK